MPWEVVRTANPDQDPSRPKPVVQPLIDTYSSVQETESPDKRTDNEIYKDIYKKEPLARMCIDNLVKGCVSGSYFFRPKKIDNFENPLILRKIEYLDYLFSEINPDFNMNELFWDLFSDYFTYFDAYQEIAVEKGMTKAKLLKMLESKIDISKIPLMVQLFPIPAETMVPEVDEHGNVARYKQQTSTGKKKYYAPKLVIHYRVPNPVKSTTGFSALATLSDPIAVSLNLRNYNGKFFENNATPRLHIDIPKGGPEEVKSFLNYAAKKLKGNPYENLVTAGGIEVKPININNQDMEFTALSKGIINEILGVYGVQPIVNGFLEDSNRSSALIQWAVFKALAIRPSQKIVIDRVNREILIRRLGIRDVVMDTTVVDNVALIEQGKIDAQDLQWGVKVINQVRNERGLKPVPWGDKPFYPLPSLQGLTNQPAPKKESEEEENEEEKNEE